MIAIKNKLCVGSRIHKEKKSIKAADAMEK